LVNLTYSVLSIAKWLFIIFLVVYALKEKKKVLRIVSLAFIIRSVFFMIMPLVLSFFRTQRNFGDLVYSYVVPLMSIIVTGVLIYWFGLEFNNKNTDHLYSLSDSRSSEGLEEIEDLDI